MKEVKKTQQDMFPTVQAGREAILKIQNRIANELPLVDIDEYFPVKHHFSPGVYTREIFLPKDSLIVGKIHKHAHPSVISQGEVVVITPHGMERLKAPLTFISEPGAKRVVYAVEDTVWTTVHVTDETDLEKIEDEVIAKTFKEFDEFTKEVTI